MKKILRNGLIIISIYAVAIICTFMVTNRVKELDNSENLRNTNTSLSINFAR